MEGTSGTWRAGNTPAITGHSISQHFSSLKLFLTLIFFIFQVESWHHMNPIVSMLVSPAGPWSLV